MARRKHAALCSVSRAEALGRREFKKGAKAVPAFSKRVRVALRHCGGTKATIAYLTAWSRGWHRANAAAPVPGMHGIFSKLFGKKKAKRHPMSKRIYWVPSPGGGRGHTKHGYAMGRARRRRR